ncbi:hypothetical protein [Lactiplantibacillus pentosus]|uniref:Uncharacterized protein n=1 Tax=Lactiplantibacillus pentosus TaxID=1589 RepID=A0AAW8VV76_LACPE|nr:hypothetical protein [Lactiplantibacillus pentosus]MBU7473617.1 hypothetical protein [Lactiplantibacillus pentosus]MCB5220061.1 hypothetical protein [Lactiplantibacillus pentosus]MDT6989721.1 hypothetical protein [Lactiplantibacillus pentosus]USJ86096.1 hypothetical protein KSF55_15415 [Lactiplantibacillus pentosus]
MTMTQDITSHFDEATETLLSAYKTAHHISKSDFIKQAVGGLGRGTGC